MKLKVWKYRGWEWECPECVGLGSFRGHNSRFVSQQAALKAAYGHLERWH